MNPITGRDRVPRRSRAARSRASAPSRTACGATAWPSPDQPDRQEGRLVLRHAGPLVGAARRLRVGRVRRRQDRHPRLGRDLLQLHQPQPVPLQRRRARSRSTRTIRNATLDDLDGDRRRRASRSPRARRQRNLPGGFRADRSTASSCRRASSSRRRTTRPTSRSSATSASTPSPKSRGSRNFGRKFWRTKTANNIPLVRVRECRTTCSTQRADQRQLPAPRLSRAWAASAT